jgi:hypothetical protein
MLKLHFSCILLEVKIRKPNLVPSTKLGWKLGICIDLLHAIVITIDPKSKRKV